jgi:DNA-binding transcriptional regulator YhcF (GntR family)
MDDIVKQLKFRFATRDDIDFITDCIIEAEKSGTQTINTCRIFNLSEEEWRDILKKILLDDIPDYDFWLSNYLIAELDGRPVCAQGAWFEGKTGKASSVIKTSMLMEYIPKGKFVLDLKTAQFVKALSIKRESGKVQMEHAYTVPDLRRRGIHTQTVLEIMKRTYDQNPSATMIQTIFFKGNCNTYNECLKLGFEPVLEKGVDDPEILNIFAHKKRIMMNMSPDKLQENYNHYRLNL